MDTVGAKEFEIIRISSVVSIVYYFVEIRDVHYAPGVMLNIMSCSRARKIEIRTIVVDCNDDGSECVPTLIQKTIEVIEIVVPKSRDGLYESSVQTEPDLTHENAHETESKFWRYAIIYPSRNVENVHRTCEKRTYTIQGSG